MLIRDVGLQLYSLHELTDVDFRGTVEKVAKMGYRGVEFAGYGGLKPDEMARFLKDNGLEAYGSHIGSLPKTDAEWDVEIEMNLAVGNKYLVCPWQDMATHDDAMRFAEVVTKTAEKLRPHGLRIGYHNHEFEFAVDKGEILLDTLLRNVPEDVFVEFDVFWVAYAGFDPLRWIRKYAGRQPLMHIKELAADRKANVEIGAGIMDFESIISLGQEIGTKHFIIEQEEYTLPPLESCKVSLDNLKSL